MAKRVKRETPSGMLPPLVRVWALAAFLFALLLLYAHRRPTMAYPLGGAALLGGLVVAWLIGAVATVRLGGMGGLSVPGSFLALFAAWAWFRTSASPVPTSGASELTRVLLGLAAFWMGGFVTGGVAGVAKLLGGDETAFSRMAGWTVCAFFALMGAVLAIHGVFEHFIIYPARIEGLLADPTFDARQPLNASILYTLRKGRVGSWFGNPNVLCGFLAMCVPMAAAWAFAWRGRRRIAARVAAVAALLLMGWAAVLTRSTGGMLVFAIGLIGSIVVALAAKGRVLRLGAGAALLAVCLVTMGGGERGAAAQGEDEAPARSVKTFHERLYYLRTAWDLWRRAPVVGHGLGGYGRLYPTARVLGSGEAQFAHNFVAQLAVETGIVGLALFGAFLVAAGWGAIRGGWSAPRVAVFGACILFLGDSLGEYIFYVREAFVDFCFLAGCVAALPSGASHPVQRRAVRMFALPVSGALIVAGFALVAFPDQMARHYRQVCEDVFAAMGSRRPAEARVLAGDALEVTSRALRWQPGNPRIWQSRAHARAAGGDMGGADRDFARAASLHPTSASIRAQWAELAWRTGRREEALRLVDEAIALYPLHSGHRVQRARYLMAMGRVDEARREAREAVRVAFQPHERREARICAREVESSEPTP